MASAESSCCMVWQLCVFSNCCYSDQSILWTIEKVIMNPSVYQINKGINKSIEFKGLKAQYIWYMGGGLVALLILFAILYICGINIFICLTLIVLLTTGLFMHVYKLSRTYGQYGLMKKAARKAVPKVIKSYSIILLKSRLLNEKFV